MNIGILIGILIGCGSEPIDPTTDSGAKYAKISDATFPTSYTTEEGIFYAEVENPQEGYTMTFLMVSNDGFHQRYPTQGIQDGMYKLLLQPEAFSVDTDRMTWELRDGSNNTIDTKAVIRYTNEDKEPTWHPDA